MTTQSKGLSVTISKNGQAVGTAEVNQDGTWTCASLAITDGDNIFTASTSGETSSSYKITKSGKIVKETFEHFAIGYINQGDPPLVNPYTETVITFAGSGVMGFIAASPSTDPTSRSLHAYQLFIFTPKKPARKIKLQRWHHTDHAAPGPHIGIIRYYGDNHVLLREERVSDSTDEFIEFSSELPIYTMELICDPMLDREEIDNVEFTEF